MTVLNEEALRLQRKGRRMSRRNLLPATTAAIMVPLLMSGCAFDPDATARNLEEGVLSSVEGVDDVLVSFSSSGFDRIPTAKLYIDDVAAADIADLTHITDSTLKAIWELMPYEPAEVGIAFANSPKPADARMGDPDTVRIDGVWQRLQLKGGGDEIFAVLGSSLAERYGER